ncbi:hypothetical protein PFISCL1PPCAC_4046, partial [Pristionchus fissidentatus]
MNTITSIADYLACPIYVLIIITCICLSILVFRGLFKMVQDALDTWFYFERNERNMTLPGAIIEDEASRRYSCWRKLLMCCYRRRIYVTECPESLHVPDMLIIMGNIPFLNVVKEGITEILSKVEEQIGGSIGKGVNVSVGTLAESITDIGTQTWRQMGKFRNRSDLWFKVPDKLVEEVADFRVDMQVVFFLGDIFQIFLIVLCCAAGGIAVRALFRTIHDCLDTLLYMKRNKWRMSSARLGIDDPIQYPFLSRVLSRIYKRDIVVEEM